MTHTKKSESVDVGYGETKARTEHGLALLASIIGPAVDIEFETSLAHVTPGCRLEIDGRDLFVGELARLQSAMPQRPQSRARDLKIVKTLALAALLEADARETIDHLVTGLPVEWYADKEALAAELTGKHHVKYNGVPMQLEILKVEVLPQPVGAIFDAILSDTGSPTDPHGWAEGKVAVIDVGNGTTDFVLMDGLNYIQDYGDLIASLTTATAGTLKHLVANAIKEKFDIEYPDTDMDEVLKTRKIIQWGNCTQIDRIVDSAVDEVVHPIIEHAQSLWPMRKTFSTVICVGGVMPMLFDEIRAVIPSAFMPPNPQTSNVDGFYKWGLLRTK